MGAAFNIKGWQQYPISKDGDSKYKKMAASSNKRKKQPRPDINLEAITKQVPT